eukprot:Anaeramoba_ignava/a90829_36.p1 GENE.a90829_36~~a90829_36.p1  ORF type:complete len:529 (-),score=167.70 a90829_36:165-1613(-)
MQEKKDQIFNEKDKEKYIKEFEDGFTRKIDSVISKELSHLNGEVYLDYTGAGVYLQSLIKKSFENYQKSLYSNAHSRSPSSLKTENEIEQVRKQILSFFHTNSSEYSVIFTSGATSALKLVGESFPWKEESKFVYSRSNHNSVLGIRGYSIENGNGFAVIPDEELWDKRFKITSFIDKTFKDNQMKENQKFTQFKKKQKFTNLDDIEKFTKFTKFTQFTKLDENEETEIEGIPHLIAYPAESNFDGSKFDLNLINQIHSQSTKEHKFYVLLDAAAFVPTNELDLSKYPADFVTISFYKMFGFPTGIGALIVRNEVTSVMKKHFFGGGTVILSCCDYNFCIYNPKPSSKFEDGTINFLSIISLKYGLEMLSSFGINNINHHVWSLTRYLFQNLKNLKHDNNKPLVEIYGNHELNDPGKQGGIISFNLKNSLGEYIGYYQVQTDSAKEGIHLRTGCHCNPGGCNEALGITSEEIMEMADSKKKL